MKRIAAPMVGGISTSFLLELLVYPAIYAFWRQRSLNQKLNAGKTTIPESVDEEEVRQSDFVAMKESHLRLGYGNGQTTV